MFFQTERVENSGESQSVLSAEGARRISAESLRQKDRAHFVKNGKPVGCRLCVFSELSVHVLPVAFLFFLRRSSKLWLNLLIGSSGLKQPHSRS